MRNWKWFFETIFVAALFFSGAINALADECDGKPRADAPVYAEGDKWHVRIIQRYWRDQQSDRPEGEYKIRYSDGKFSVSRLSDDTNAPLLYASEASEVLRMAALGNEAKVYLGDFPLCVGKTWKRSYKAYGQNRIANMSVLSIKSVKTEAGACEGFEIGREDIIPSASILTFTYSFCPDKKSVVKYVQKYSSPYLGSGLTESELIKSISGEKNN